MHLCCRIALKIWHIFPSVRRTYIFIVLYLFHFWHQHVFDTTVGCRQRKRLIGLNSTPLHFSGFSTCSFVKWSSSRRRLHCKFCSTCPFAKPYGPWKYFTKVSSIEIYLKILRTRYYKEKYFEENNLCFYANLEFFLIASYDYLHVSSITALCHVSK